MRRPLPGYALGAEQLWQHALGTAIGAAYVAERSGKAIPDTTFTAGLLHDIGKLAMSVWLDRKLSALLKIAEIEGTPFDQVERRVLGYDHTEVGEHLVRKWNLPESLVMPVRWHHRPDEAPAGNPMVDCVHLADYFSMAMGLGIGGDGMRYVLSEGSFTRLSLSLDALPEMVSDFVERYARQSAAFHEVTT
jgi:putative nucleotidyltransferase with HDIG domain